MIVTDKRVYTGRNIYSHKVCIRLTVDTQELCDTPTKDIEGFNERLLKALPNLRTHKCALGYEGGFVQRLKEGTYLSHVMEHMIIEMQNELGFMNVKYGKARCVHDSVYHVIYQYELKEAGLLCGEYALECINTLIRGEDYDMRSAMEDIERRIAEIRLGPSTQGLYDEAVKRGIPVTRIGRDSVLQFGYGKYIRMVEGTIVDETSCISVDMSCDKSITRQLLQDACLPIPEGVCCRSIDELDGVCKKIGFPVVIKPYDGNHGNGVTVDVNGIEEAKDAFREAMKVSDRIIVEKYIKGRDYRVLVVNGSVVAVSLRTPPYVCGDGVHTIRELIEQENQNPSRGYNHEKAMTKIAMDDMTKKYLAKSGNTLDDVLPRGERIVLRFNANISTGGSARDCTDIIHPDNIDIAIRAAQTIGLNVAGIDICTPDIAKPIRETGGAVLEVNAAPGIRMHMYPSKGKARNAAGFILDYMYPQGEPSSIPIVSVTGTNGKTTVTRMISHILSLKGKNVGMTTTSGIYINNRCIMMGDTTGPDSARAVLMNRSVDAAVLETARGGILRRGLGYDLADVAVITNITPDHLGLEGVDTIEELANVKALVIEAVRSYGYAVLNADDSVVTMLMPHLRSKVIYFSKSADNIILKKHILGGGMGVFIRDGFIFVAREDKIQPVIKVSDIPSTFEGKLGYNIENSLAATAACLGLKLDTSSIAKGLKTFYLDNEQNPGRFNIYNVDNFRVIVDYGHNRGGYMAVLEGLRQMELSKLTGIIGVPGDRRDEDIIEVGRLAGEGFDYIYIKEDMDKRGRKESEVAGLIEQGVRIAGRDKCDYSVVLSEGEALKTAMQNAVEGETIIIFYEDYNLVKNIITNFKRNCKKLDRSMDVI